MLAWLDPDVSVVRSHDLAADRQTEARVIAAAALRRRSVGIEALEHLLAHIFWHTWTFIREADVEFIAITTECDQHGAVIRRK